MSKKLYNETGEDYVWGVNQPDFKVSEGAKQLNGAHYVPGNQQLARHLPEKPAPKTYTEPTAFSYRRTNYKYLAYSFPQHTQPAVTTSKTETQSPKINISYTSKNIMGGVKLEVVEGRWVRRKMAWPMVNCRVWVPY